MSATMRDAPAYRSSRRDDLDHMPAGAKITREGVGLRISSTGLIVGGNEASPPVSPGKLAAQQTLNVVNTNGGTIKSKSLTVPGQAGESDDLNNENMTPGVISRPSVFEHPLLPNFTGINSTPSVPGFHGVNSAANLNNTLLDDDSDEEEDPEDAINDSVFSMFLKKKEDPLDKIKRWKPKKWKPAALKGLPKSNPQVQMWRAGQREKKLEAKSVIDGALVNQSLIRAHEQDIPEDWDEFRKMSWTFFQDDSNVVVTDVQNYLYHSLTHESIKLLNFLSELMGRSQLKLLPFRSFDSLHVPKKHEKLFRTEQENLEKRKIRRQVVKCAACLNLRCLGDLLHVSEAEWNRGRLPVRLIDVKKEALKYMSDELSDLERASFWGAVAETQRPLDHRRNLSFPAKHEKLGRSALGQIPYHHVYKQSGQARSPTGAGKQREGSLHQLFGLFDQKTGGRSK